MPCYKKGNRQREGRRSVGVVRGGAAHEGGNERLRVWASHAVLNVFVQSHMRLESLENVFMCSSCTLDVEKI